MLENTILIDGKEGKDLDQLCKDYADVSVKFSDLEKTKKLLAEKIKAICTKQGNYETLKYFLKITECKGAENLNKEKLKEELPEIYKKYVVIGSPYLKINRPVLKGERC